MISETQKLENFHSAIDHYALEQRRTIEDEVARLKKERLAEAESQVLSEAFRMIQKEMSDMRHRISREMALREVEARRNLLLKRSEIQQKVFALAAEKLRKFTKTPDYASFLKARAKALASLFTAPGTVLYMRHEDAAYFPVLKAALGTECTCEEDPSIRIGGFYAENRTLGLFADSSFDSLLREQVPWFEENSGIAVV